MVSGNVAHFFDTTLILVFMLVRWASHGVCEKDAAGEGWLALCTGVAAVCQLLLRGEVGSSSADGAENPFIPLCEACCKQRSN